jgi:GR25 family glycosyltransferase involved in LPS biosynthesis
MNSNLNVVVISFPESPRRNRASANLNALGLPWRYFDALREPPPHLPQYNEAESIRFWGRALSRSEIGCAASHIAVLSEISACREDSWVLVIEDDVALDPGFDYRALVDLCKVGQIGYLRLYARHLPRLRNVAWVGQRELIRFEKAPMGTQAYLISSKKAQSFVRSLRSINRPIDWEMDCFWRNRLANYALFPFPCIELTSGSSIKKQPDCAKAPSAFDRAVWFAWKSKEAFRRLFANLLLRRQDRAIRTAFEQRPLDF